MKTTGKPQNLVLDKIVGVRPDIRPKSTVVPLKKEPGLKKIEPARNATGRTTKDGYKF